MVIRSLFVGAGEESWLGHGQSPRAKTKTKREHKNEVEHLSAKSACGQRRMRSTLALRKEGPRPLRSGCYCQDSRRALPAMAKRPWPTGPKTRNVQNLSGEKLARSLRRHILASPRPGDRKGGRVLDHLNCNPTPVCEIPRRTAGMNARIAHAADRGQAQLEGGASLMQYAKSCIIIVKLLVCVRSSRMHAHNASL
jgi:hypothetical protein